MTNGDALVSAAMFLWMLAALFYTIMLRGVEREAPLRGVLEANNLSRVWREHKRHFPDSRLRKVVATLTIAGAVCFLAAGFFA